MTADFASARATPNARSRPSRLAVQIWLGLVALLVFGTVIVGGATRLTGSGLSITEWQPIMGALPPLTHADWEAAFAKYREILQFAIANRDMTLTGFQVIFWWEWAHRFLGRIIGAVFLLPFLVFLATGRIRRAEIPTFAGLFVLGGLQGAIGWWMVASGLVDRINVAPYRLAIHLTLACLIFAALVWTAITLDTRRRAGAATALSGVVIAAVLVQIFLGALVAGNNAGVVYNTWPTMTGYWLPPDLFSIDELWRNFFENPAMVQFVHRLGAYMVFALAMAEGARWIANVNQSGRARVPGKPTAIILIVAAAAQGGIGIATLLAYVPLHLALAHQAGAVVLLLAAVVHRAVLGRVSSNAAA